jgi:cyclase
MVRNRKVCNLKIRRQHPIGPFIADFYCHELLLVIEVDGSIHELEEIKQKDLSRENYLKDNGLKVLRFSNDDVMLNSHIIEEKIKEFIDLSKKT